MLPSIYNDDLFDVFWRDPFMVGPGYGPGPHGDPHGRDLMKTDVKDSGDHYEMDIDLPGFKKEDVQLDLKDGYLTISATTKSEPAQQSSQNGRYLRRERYYGSCARRFYVGDVQPSEVRASFEDGILRLTVPKHDPQPKLSHSYIPID